MGTEVGTSTTASRTALALCGLTGAATAANIVLLASRPPGDSSTLGNPWIEVAAAVGYLVVAVIGAVELHRRSSALGLALSVPALLAAFGAFASEFGNRDPAGTGELVPRLVAWAGSWAWWGGIGGGLTFIFLLLPDGRLPSPRWRPAVALGAVLVGALVALHALTPGPLDGEFDYAVNPVGIGALRQVLDPLRDLAWLLVVAGALLGLLSLGSRMGRADRRRRVQLAWLSLAATGAAAALIVGGKTPLDRPTPLLAQVAAVIGGGACPAAAVAIGRSAALRRSLERLVRTREEERQRIRRDLHDGLGPTLASAVLQLGVAREVVERDPRAAVVILDRLANHLQAAIGDVRRIVDDLRPAVLDQFGLASAIEERAAAFGGPGGMQVTVEAHGEVERLPAAVELATFRIAMEALNNAARHARAGHCVVTLSVDGAVDLCVRDDGCGLPADATPGVGLESMRQRAAELGGSCAVERAPEGGTVVRARLPVAI